MTIVISPESLIIRPLLFQKKKFGFFSGVLVDRCQKKPVGQKPCHKSAKSCNYKKRNAQTEKKLQTGKTDPLVYCYFTTWLIIGNFRWSVKMKFQSYEELKGNGHITMGNLEFFNLSEIRLI